MNILVVDDEKIALDGLSNNISKAVPTAKLFIFQSALKAKEYAQNNPIDIAFLDVQMRSITGLQLAKSIKKYHPNVNIIFVTGYEAYMKNAISLHASGYLVKPTTMEDIKHEIANLLYPLPIHKSDLSIKTFGNFEVIYKDKPLHFDRLKSKELLAYLIDREGASCTRQELMAILFEDDAISDKNQNYFTHIWSDLIKSLKTISKEGIVEKKHNSYYFVSTEEVYIDFIKYLEGNVYEINNFHGEYMNQYSWAEYSKNKFYESEEDSY